MAVGLMEVLLVNARGLGDTDIIGRMDPYVVVKYKSQEHRTGVSRGHGGNPVWNERFILRVEYPGSGDQYKLTLKIMDKDTFTADDTIGEATIYVKDLLEIGVEKGSAEIHPKKYSVVAADKTFRGDIQVGVTFTKKNVSTGDKNSEDGSIVYHIHRGRNTIGDVLESDYEEKWHDIKLCAFDNANHRTYVDLKDKWKTLVHKSLRS